MTLKFPNPQTSHGQYDSQESLPKEDPARSIKSSHPLAVEIRLAYRDFHSSLEMLRVGKPQIAEKRLNLVKSHVQTAIKKSASPDANEYKNNISHILDFVTQLSYQYSEPQWNKFCDQATSEARSIMNQLQMTTEDGGVLRPAQALQMEGISNDNIFLRAETEEPWNAKSKQTGAKNNQSLLSVPRIHYAIPEGSRPPQQVRSRPYRALPPVPVDRPNVAPTLSQELDNKKEQQDPQGPSLPKHPRSAPRIRSAIPEEFWHPEQVRPYRALPPIPVDQPDVAPTLSQEQDNKKEQQDPQGTSLTTHPRYASLMRSAISEEFWDPELVNPYPALPPIPVDQPDVAPTLSQEQDNKKEQQDPQGPSLTKHPLALRPGILAHAFGIDEQKKREFLFQASTSQLINQNRENFLQLSYISSQSLALTPFASSQVIFPPSEEHATTLRRHPRVHRVLGGVDVRQSFLNADPAGDKIKILDDGLIRAFGSIKFTSNKQIVKRNFRFSSITGKPHEGHIVAGSMIGSGTYGKVRPGVLISPDGKTKTNVIIKESRMGGVRNLAKKDIRNRFNQRRNINVTEQEFEHEKQVASLLGGDVRVLGTRKAGDKKYLILTAMDMSAEDAAKTGLRSDQRALLARHTGLEVAKHLHNHVHRYGYVHGDGKPSNTLIDVAKNRVYASDFGGSKKMTKHFFADGRAEMGVSQLVSTYWAPEFSARSFATQKFDSWTLGITIAQLMAGNVQYPSEFFGVRNNSGHIDKPATWKNVSGIARFRHQMMTKEAQEGTAAPAIDNKKWKNRPENHLGRFFQKLAIQDQRLANYVLLHLLDEDPDTRHSSQQAIEYLTAMNSSNHKKEVSLLFDHIYKETAQMRQAHEKLHNGIAFLENKDLEVFKKI